MTITTIDVKRLKAYAEHEIDYIIDCLYAVAMDRIEDRLFYRRRGEKIYGQCPCFDHGGDRSGQQSFSWNNELKIWACWSHHCEKDYGSSIISLVRVVVGLSFKDSLEWLRAKLEKCGGFVPSAIAEKPSVAKNNLPPVDELRLKFLLPQYDCLTARGFDPAILRYYEAGFWYRPGTFMHNRIVFPIRDELGSLVGFTGRTVYDAEESKRLGEQKWKHGRFFDRHVEGFQGGQYLYNLFRAKRHLAERRIILVEGPLDGMRLEEAGIHNWVACLGCSMGKAHKDLLVEHNVNHIDLALDPDEAGDKASIRIIKEFGQYFHFNRVRLSKDPGECAVTELRKIWL
jgi:5S rRNA maturation endonuclease (ribonuclease M5)